MYSRFQKNIINDEVLELINQLLNLLKESNKIKLSSDSQIHCLNNSTKISSISSNEIAEITEDDLNISAKEVDDYISRYNNVLEYIKTNSDSIQLTVWELQKWHNELLKKTLVKNHHGRLSKSCDNMLYENNDAFFNDIRLSKTHQLIEELINWYNSSDLPKIIKIIIFIIDFLMISPFSGGNGLMSRLLMNYLLIKEGFTFFKYVSLEEIILDNQEQYKSSLKITNRDWNTPNCDYFSLIKLFLNTLNISLMNFLDIFDLSNLFFNKKVNKEKLVINVINFLRNRNTEIKKSTIAILISNLDIKISEQTIKNTLRKLVSTNDLALESHGKNTVYVTTEKFQKTLSNMQTKIFNKKRRSLPLLKF